MIKSYAYEAKVTISNETDDALIDSDPIRDVYSGDNEESQGIECLVYDGEAGRNTVKNDAELAIRHDEEENIPNSGESGQNAQVEVLTEPNNTVFPRHQTKQVCPLVWDNNRDDKSERRHRYQFVVEQTKEADQYLRKGESSENPTNKKSETQDPESERQDTEYSKTENSESDFSAAEYAGAERKQILGSEKAVKLLRNSEPRTKEPCRSANIQVGKIKINKNEDEESAQEDSISTELTEVLSEALTMMVSRVMNQVMKKVVRRVLTQQGMSSLIKRVVTRVLTRALERSLAKI